jgi:hypothetical protein
MTFDAVGRTRTSSLATFRRKIHDCRDDATIDLRRHLAGLSGTDPEKISQGAITYQLRRLRLHGFIERLPQSFRYRVFDFGFRAVLFFTRIYNRPLRSGLAAALPGLRAFDIPLKGAFDKIDARANEWVNQAQLAA